MQRGAEVLLVQFRVNRETPTYSGLKRWVIHEKMTYRLEDGTENWVYIRPRFPVVTQWAWKKLQRMEKRLGRKLTNRPLEDQEVVLDKLADHRGWYKLDRCQGSALNC